MKKITLIFLTALALFTFVACENPTGAKEDIESTLTIPVKNLNEITFSGVWQAVSENQYDLDQKRTTFYNTIQYAFSEENVSLTYSSAIVEIKLFTQADYDDYKNITLEENQTNWTISFYDKDKTVIEVAKENYLDSLNELISYDEFINSFSNMTITTNDSKTTILFESKYGKTVMTKLQ